MNIYYGKSANQLKPKIRILALSRGGARGAYETGVIDGLTQRFNGYKEGIAYDSVTALNMAIFSSFAKGDECAAAHSLRKIWLDKIKGNESIYECRSIFSHINMWLWAVTSRPWKNESVLKAGNLK